MTNTVSCGFTCSARTVEADDMVERLTRKLRSGFSSVAPASPAASASAALAYTDLSTQRRPDSSVE
ncbi:hypothetical protein BN3658_00597 [Coriobacteriaceae bacterium CHKCI002]|nr:hypothetical protein BN3658_00597 [Coriobacteriaceae bacterium CHKCI002]